MKQTHPLEQFRFCPECGYTPFMINNKKSKRCPRCGFTYYFNPSSATVAVIVNEHGEWLVCRRGKEPAKGTLDLPGGFCDCYETAEEGMIREVEEETGLRVTALRYLFSQPNTYLYSGFLVHTTDLFFQCKVDSESVQPHAMDDAAELIWIAPEQIRPADFGLDSVRAGILRLLREQLLTDTNT